MHFFRKRVNGAQRSAHSLMCLLLLAVVLRMLVPVGYMPDTQALQQGRWVLGFCSVTLPQPGNAPAHAGSVHASDHRGASQTARYPGKDNAEHPYVSGHADAHHGSDDASRHYGWDLASGHPSVGSSNPASHLADQGLQGAADDPHSDHATPAPLCPLGGILSQMVLLGVTAPDTLASSRFTIATPLADASARIAPSNAPGPPLGSRAPPVYTDFVV